MTRLLGCLRLQPQVKVIVQGSLENEKTAVMVSGDRVYRSSPVRYGYLTWG